MWWNACEGLTKGLAIATKVAANSSLTNFAATHLLTRIAQGRAKSAAPWKVILT